MGCCCNRDHYCLRINVVRAEGFSNKYDVFGSIDAYVECRYGGKKQKTQKVKNNQSPTWNEILTFEGVQLGHPLEICVMDWDRLTKNDFVGEATLHDVLPNNYNVVKEHNFTVKDKQGNETGRVYIKMEFVHEAR